MLRFLILVGMIVMNGCNVVELPPFQLDENCDIGQQVVQEIAGIQLVHQCMEGGWRVVDAQVETDEVVSLDDIAHAVEDR